ncbi:MarR family transcriptional regulator [Nakamurella sp. YIM 132087]|uniref:MarR family transcriptional regulator n=2 Tax=Nakamurella alba TaxID=2665158 RepID=A0A7K1FEZ6_9ACTN|nr:MarR family transcriptional regulator [Nakamurella alba]
MAAVEDEVTVTQLRALVVLSTRGDLDLRGLADAMGVHPSNATRLCDRLVAAGLVVRRDNQNDRRHLVLTVTSRGRAVVDAVTEARRQAVGDVLERLAPERRGAVVDALAEFARAGGEPAPDDLRKMGWPDHS